jgi:site-specific DNA-methyltransferase (adenine-specific)/modification methylase
MMEINKIYTGDCTETMKSFSDAVIDLIYADPPYNLSGKPLSLVNNKTGGPFYKMNETWDTWSHTAYVNFTKKWIEQAFRILKPGGSLYVSCTLHNIGEIICAAKDIAFKLKNIITWYKTNAMPNITKRTYTHATEYVCWFVKGKNWKFNYNELKKFNPQKTKTGELKQMRDFIELPIVQGKERLKKSDGRAIHPTQKPEKLIELILRASSDVNDVVLDPFFGTGTTGAVAEKLHRRWIGIEMNSQYVNIANRRIFGQDHVKRS